MVNPHEFRIAFHYVSKGATSTINAALQKKAERVKARAQDLFSAAKVTFKFWGAGELVEEIQRQPATSLPLQLAEGPLELRGEGRAMIGLVPLAEFYKFITDGNGLLRQYIFESNVRDWQGNNKVNRAIAATLQNAEGTEDFWWLNNGVTILASGVSAHGGHLLKIDNPQIVNGLQTSRAIYEANPSGDQKRHVLVRIITPEYADSADRIIKATNSQTKIPEYRLHATEKIEKDIETYFSSHGMYYDRRKNFYKNMGRSVIKIVEPLYLAQAVIAMLLERPDEARARPSSVLNESYKKVFDRRYPLEMFLQCALIMKRVDEYLRSVRPVIERKDRLNVRFYVAWDWVQRKIGTPTQRHRPAELAKLGIPTDSELLVSYEPVNEQYRNLGASDQVAKGPDLLKALRA
jgi:hypothetical protein